MTDHVLHNPAREPGKAPRPTETLLDYLNQVLGHHNVVWVQGEWNDAANKPIREGVYIVRESVVNKLCQYPDDWDEVVGVNFEDCEAHVPGTLAVTDAVVFTEAAE